MRRERTTSHEKGENGCGRSQRQKVAFLPGAFEPEEESDLGTGRHHHLLHSLEFLREARRRES